MLNIIVVNPCETEKEYIFNEINIEMKMLNVHYNLYMQSLYEESMQIQYTYDIYFICVDRNEEFGFVETLRKYNLLATILFIVDETLKIEHLIKYRPTGIIRRGSGILKIQDKLKNAVKEQENILDKQYFYVQTREKITKIFYREIDYFESHQRKVTVYYCNCKNNLEFYGKIDLVIKTITNAQFVRCHQSLIVNMDKIRVVDKVNRKLILKNGIQLEISKRYFNGIVETILSKNTVI